MMALLRDRFYQEYKRHTRNGFYPIRDREVMRDIYEQYHALGGNGVITHLKEELDELLKQEQEAEEGEETEA